MLKQATRSITVRVRANDLKKVMKARSMQTQSEAINTLITEEAERIKSLAVLRATAGTAREDEFDDRLL